MHVNFKRAVIVLLFVSFIINLGFSAISPMFPYLILAFKGLLNELPEVMLEPIEAHRGAVEFGILMAAFMLTRAPTAALTGFLSDVLGRKVTMMIGIILYFLVSIGFVLSNSVMELIGLRAIQGVASAMVWPVAEAYIADVTPRWDRGKAISAYSASMLIAEMIGPAIGVAVYKGYIFFFGTNDVIMALKSPMIFLAIMSLLSIAIIIILPRIPGKIPRSNLKKDYLLQLMKKRMKDIKNTINELPRSISLSIKAIYANGIVNGISIGIIHTVALVYVIEEVVKDPLYLGIYFTIFSMAALPATMVSGYVSDKIKKRKPIALLGFFIGRLTFFFIPLIKDFIVLLILAALPSLVFGLSMPAMRALQADLIPHTIRGTIFGAQQLFLNSGIFLGSILGGFLTNIYAKSVFKLLGLKLSGYIVPFWIAGFLGLIATIVFAIYVTERARTEDLI